MRKSEFAWARERADEAGITLTREVGAAEPYVVSDGKIRLRTTTLAEAVELVGVMSHTEPKPYDIRGTRLVSAEDAMSGDVVENEQGSRAYVITPTADDMVLVRWDNGTVAPEHYNRLYFVKCRG